jgi:hypothetical protein
MTLVWASGFNGVTDPDVQTYIAAVEAADGQAIEGNVAYAINDFVVGCKDDGIWDAIKASCILAGARTLSGALVPLKGTAPTNVNFVSGDYNRETGLVGDRSTKYLNSNRKNDADPQNSKHVSVYTTNRPTFTSGAARTYIGTGQSTGSTHLSFSGGFVDSIAVRLNSSSGTNNAIANVVGFIGANRNVSAGFIVRSGGVNSSLISVVSANPFGNTLRVFDGVNKSNARLTFYSIGEAIDLEKLDTRTSQLMRGISYGVSPDADAQAYIQAVETADNRKLEFYVAAAINAFVVGCKTDGIWDAIKSSCILAGARTLAGALVPLKGVAPENGSGGSYQFVEADYDRKLGLQGSKASPFPFIRPNRNSNDDPQNDHHASVYVTQQGTIAGGANWMLYAVSGSDFNNIVWSNNTLATRSRDTAAFVSGSVIGLGATFLGISRSSSSSFDTRYYGTTSSTSSTSVTPTAAGYVVLGVGNSTNFNGRGSFYSIGESLDLALLDARVSTLMTDIGAAIP